MIALHQRLPRPSGLCSERFRKSQRSRQPNKAPRQICQGSFAFESPVEEMKLPDTTRRRKQSTKCGTDFSLWDPESITDLKSVPHKTRQTTERAALPPHSAERLRLSDTSIILLRLRLKSEA